MNAGKTTVHSSTGADVAKPDDKDGKFLNLAKCLSMLTTGLEGPCVEFATPGHRMGLAFQLMLNDIRDLRLATDRS